MSREIKCRAWDTVRKVMYSAEELGADQETLSVDGRGFVNVSGDNTRLSQFHTHLLPLEYTGLKDKNGKEIYEGDIFRITREPQEDNVVEFYEGSYHLEEHGLDLSDWYEHGEVIGNIYENLELLESKK